MATIYFPWQYVPDPTSGRPVPLGKMFFGIPDLDPEIPANQIQARVKQEDGTILDVAQPVLLNAGGVPTYLGSPVILDIVEEEFSWKILNSLDAQVYYNENNTPYQWDTNQIVDGAITTIKIADAAITTPKIADDAVDKDKIFSDVAGFGLVQNTTVGVNLGQLDVNADDSTLEVDPILDVVRVKDLGVTYGKMQLAVGNEVLLGNVAGAGSPIVEVPRATVQSWVAPVAPTAGDTYIIKRMTGSAGSINAGLSGGQYPDADESYAQGSMQNPFITIDSNTYDQVAIQHGCNVLIAGTIRITFTHFASGLEAFARIIHNGSQVQTFSTLAGVSSNKSFDLAVSLGDSVVIQHRAGSSTGAPKSYCRNLFIRSGTQTPAVA